MTARPGGAALLAVAVTVVVAAVVLAALIVLGPPAAERARRLDEQRVFGLMSLERAIEVRYDETGELPESLDDLRDEVGPAVPTDPVTDEPFRYRPTGDRSYELCATFDTASPTDAGEPWIAERVRWHHPAGPHCVELEVDERDARGGAVGPAPRRPVRDGGGM